jgi:hypothetical protein
MLEHLRTCQRAATAWDSFYQQTDEQGRYVHGEESEDAG